MVARCDTVPKARCKPYTVGNQLSELVGTGGIQITDVATIFLKLIQSTAILFASVSMSTSNTTSPIRSIGDQLGVHTLSFILGNAL